MEEMGVCIKLLMVIELRLAQIMMPLKHGIDGYI